jgi:hypothetical protein
MKQQQIKLTLNRADELLEKIGFVRTQPDENTPKSRQQSTWKSEELGTLIIPQQGKTIQQTTFQNALYSKGKETGKLTPDMINRLMKGESPGVLKDANLLESFPPLNRELSAKQITSETMLSFLQGANWERNPDGITSFIKKGIKGKLDIMPDYGDGDRISGNDAHKAILNLWRQNTDPMAKQDLVTFHDKVVQHLEQK